MQSIQSVKNNEKIIIILVIVLIFIINFFHWSFFSEPLNGIIWVGDDATHISFANSFRENQDFTLDFSSDRKLYYDIHNLFERYPTIHTQLLIKGPVYYVFLGTIYQILDVTV